MLHGSVVSPTPDFLPPAADWSVSRLGTGTGTDAWPQPVWRKRELDLLEEERRRLARDLHDEAGHRLTAAILQLDIAAQAQEANAEVRDCLAAARRLIQECAAGLHEVAFNLRPCILADLGVAPAVRSLARRASEATGLSVTVEVEGTARRLPERIELALFRTVQEALTNALKYANATTIIVRLTFGDEACFLEVADDGLGFDPTQSHGDRPRLGLSGMRERARLLGGEMVLRTRPGCGTTVAVCVPVRETGS